MDEPAAGLPEAEVPEFAAVVRAVRDDHEAGVLLIDHNMALIMDVCDRIQVLDQGRTLADGTPGRDPRQPRCRLRVSRRERRARGEHMSGRDARGVRARRRLRRRRGGPRSLVRGRARRDRRPDRAERRRQVDDLPRDHGIRPARGRARSCSPERRSSVARPEDVARSGVALVPEGRRIFAELTRRGEPPARARGPPQPRGGGADIGAVFELFPVVREFRRRPAGALSGGQQQQLAIARALVAAPRRAPARRALARPRRPPSSTSSSRRCTRSATAASPSSSSSSGPSARSPSPTAPT